MATSKTPVALQINPENYVCHQTNGSLNIDGQALESDWQKAAWTASFVDIQGDLQAKPSLDTKVKMLWDDTYFYFYAKMEEPHIWGTLKQRDTVIFYDDDFEIFIDPDGDSHNYYEIELNALNTLWDLILLRPYRADKAPKVLNEWNISNILTAVHIEGTLNDPSDQDQFWSVEMAVPWSALMELAPRKKRPLAGDQWRINFSRVDWTMEVENNIYKKKKNPKTGKTFPEDNWVWSPTGKINMHMPEQWGFVQFSESKVGEKEVDFISEPDEVIKQALWNLYFQQINFHKTYGYYAEELQHFKIPELKNSPCKFHPMIFSTPSLFEITAPSCKVNQYWSIRQDGKIVLVKKNE